MMKRICPKCGGHTFRAYQKRVHAAIVNEENQQIGMDSDQAVEFEEPTGLYECVDCGEEFDSLDDLKAIVTYSDLVFTNVEEIFEEPLPLDTKEENLMSAIRETVAELAAEKENMKGYYCWKAFSNEGADRKGMMRIIRMEGRDPDVRVFENPGAAALQISIPALQRVQKLIPVRKVSSDRYLVSTCQVHVVEPVCPVRSDAGEITIRLISSEQPTFLTLTQSAFDNILIRYKSNEDGISGLYSDSDLSVLYQTTVDKTEYPTYSGWEDDMLRSGVFVQI